MPQQARVSILLTAKDLTGSAITGVKTKLAGLRTSIGSAFTGLQGAMTAAFAGLSALTVGRFILDTERQFQGLSAQLRTFTGSSDAAAAKFAEMQRLAIELPYELTDVTQAWIDLRQTGLEPTSTMIERLSDQASSFGGNVKDLSHAVVRAVAGEFEPLRSFGVQMTIVGNQLRASFQGHTTMIERNARAIVGYLTQISQSNFAGASERRMQTLDGQISNLQDNLHKLADVIAKGGVADAFADAAGRLSDMAAAAAENRVATQQWTAVVLSAGAAIVQTFIAPIRVGLNAISALGRAALIVLGAINLILGTIGAGFIRLAILQAKWSGQSTTALERMRDAADRFARQGLEVQQAALRGIAQDGRDSYDAIQNLGQSYRDAAQAAGQVGTAEAGVNQHLFTGLTAREKAIDAAKTEAILATDRAKKQAAINRLLALQAEAQAQLNQGFKNGLTMQDPHMQRFLKQVVDAGAAIADAQQPDTPAGGGTSDTDPLKTRIEMLTEATKHDATRAAAVRELTTLERELARAEQRGNLTLAQRTDLARKVADIQQALNDLDDGRVQTLIAASQFEETRPAALQALAAEEARLAAALRATNLTLEERVRLEKQRKDVHEAITTATTGVTEERIDLLAKATTIERTRAAAIAQLRDIERQLEAAQAQGNAVTADGVRVDTQLAQVREVLYHATVDALSAQIDLGTRAARLDATRADGRARLLSLEQQIRDELTQGNLPLQERVDLLERLLQIEAALDETGTFWQRLNAHVNQGQTAMQRFHETLNAITDDLLGGFRDGIEGAFAAVVEGSGNAGRTMASAFVGALGTAASKLGDFFQGQAIAAAASQFTPPFNPMGLQSAALWEAAAVAMYGLAGSLSGASNKISAGGSNRAGGSGASSAEAAAGDRGQATIVVEGGLLDMSDPRQAEALAAAIENVSGRRVTVRKG